MSCLWEDAVERKLAPETNSKISCLRWCKFVISLTLSSTSFIHPPKSYWAPPLCQVPTVPGCEDTLWTKHGKVPAGQGETEHLSTWHHGVWSSWETSCLKFVCCLSSLVDTDDIKGEATDGPAQFHQSSLYYLIVGWTQGSPSTNLGLSFLIYKMGRGWVKWFFFLREGELLGFCFS